MSDEYLKPILDRLANDHEYEVRQVMELITSREMAEILANEIKPEIKVQSLSEEILPHYYQRERYAHLLKANPKLAVEYWQMHARTADKFVDELLLPKPMKPMSRQEIMKVFERRRLVNEVNARPMKRRI